MTRFLYRGIPLLLASSVLAAPAVVPQVEAGEAHCPAPVVVTVAKTVYLPAGATPPAVAKSRESYSRQSPTAAVPTVVPVPAKEDGHKGGGGSPGHPGEGGHHRSGGLRSALYFTNWGIYGANFQPQQVPVDDVTHILYAFADIAPDGEVKSSDSWSDTDKHYEGDSWNDSGNNVYGCVKQLFLHKQKNRHLKLLLSIGGWTYSSKFAPVAATEAGRQRFAATAVKLVSDWGFDGIDIDWEYPKNAQEAKDFVSLLKTCRQALDEYAAKSAPGYHFVITVASPAGSQNYNVMDLEGMDPLVDGWHLMAYDYAGSWDQTTGHQAALYANPGNIESTKFNTETAVDAYIRRGISPSKIVLGIPLYGRSFLSTDGIGKPYNGLGQGSIESGVWLYKDLPRPGATEMWDGVAEAAYSYDPATRELVSYDTVQSAGTKAKWLVEKGLGGVVFWEASGDRSGERSLVGTVAKKMAKLDSTPNLLSYPSSRFDNIRNGMK